MTSASAREGTYERAARKAVQARARLERLQAQARVRDKKREATRRYRLGQALEGFLFDEPELLAQFKEVVQDDPLEHVCVAFRLVARGPSWLEKPDGADTKSAINTRRIRLGMIVEGMLPFDAVLRARLEALMRQQTSYVREVFGLEGSGPSWFSRFA